MHHHAHSNGSKAPTGAAGSAVEQTAGLAPQEAAASGTNCTGTLAEGQTTAVQPYGAHLAHVHHHNVPGAGGQPLAPAPAGGMPAGPAPVAVRGTLFPAIGTIVQAGAFGAALGGISAGVCEAARVKQGEISSEEAIRNVVKSATQGATTMAVASVAGHMVRSHPVVGFLVLATAGIGALAVLSNSKPVKKAAVAKAPRVAASASKAAKKPASATPRPA